MISDNPDHEPKKPPFEDVSGVILAGGKSRRYGKNKALVEIDGIPLIERVIGVMKSIFSHLLIITNTPHEYAHLDIPMQEDHIKGLGPLGGIYSGLISIPNEYGFFVACDMPSLNRELILHMVDVRENFDVVVPEASSGLETLHALYSKQCLSPINELIDAGEYQVFRFFSKVSVHYVDEPTIRRFDPQLRSFFNINRPQESRRLNRT